MIRIALAIAGAAGLLCACGPREAGTPASPPEAAATAPVAAPAEEQTVTLADGEPGLPGQKVYEEVCRDCHEKVGAGAPQTGQSPDWTERSALWQAVLFEHANQGYLEMPAKGGEEGLSEDDVAAAAEYMLNQSFPERTDDPR